MGAWTSRQNEVEEAEQINSHAYKYPPRSGNFFGSHFIMGGERFDTPQPESYLFGENVDLNFLGNRPTAFPYPPPQANEPTKTLKSLVNIRKESVRFVRVPQEKPCSPDPTAAGQEQPDGNVLCSAVAASDLSGGDGPPPPCLYNIEFTFDADAKCAITIYYFCTEEVSPSGVTLVPREGLTSETYRYGRGINQCFVQAGHVFNPQLIPEDDLAYNPGREQYPVAIHCVIEEGNEECRQSHTTVCVIDHHAETQSYVLRALKQKIFVDGLCYLLQEIYGIENKAVNKSSLDEDLDDHGSECVICMSETRDTLILPCRHLCLCNSCADSLRYQANNCPICRSPFRALLQIRAVQKGVGGGNVLHQNTPTSVAGDPSAAAQHCEVHYPLGYTPVSLIEALNGPPQFVGRVRPHDGDGDGMLGASGDPHKTTSPPQSLGKSNGHRRVKVKKSVSTNTSEVATPTATATGEGDGKGATTTPSEKADRQEKLQIVNERKHSLKVPKNKRPSSTASALAAAGAPEDEDDDDSENEKLSPLLSPGSGKAKAPPTAAKTTAKTLNIADDESASVDTDNDDTCAPCTAGVTTELKSSASASSLKRAKGKRTDAAPATVVGAKEPSAVTINTEDSDYYTPEDAQNSILSPLCPDRSRAVDKLGSLKGSAGSFKGAGHLAKKNLHKKSTSVGNIVGPMGISGGTGGTAPDLKGNVSSLPDMLDSPAAGGGGVHSASTRSSSDSYSSSSSTKQLLSSNPTTAATNPANIIVDDRTSLQNAVNV